MEVRQGNQICNRRRLERLGLAEVTADEREWKVQRN